MHSDTIKIDFHVHSVFSHDAKIPIKELVSLWNSKQILSLVCDHDTINGSRYFWREFSHINIGIEPVYAEEITTTDGEIIGLFLQDEISARNSAAETVDEIHDQDGLVLIPHPFDRIRRRSIDPLVLDSLIEDIDIIEGFNSRTFFQGDNLKANQYGMLHKKPLVSGSDAHLISEIGKVYVEIDMFDTPQALLKNLHSSVHTKKTASPFVHIFTKLHKVFR